MLHLKRSALVVVALVGVSASGCGVSDVVAPPVAPAALTQPGVSAFIPAASLVRAGIPDGVYTFRIQPNKDQTLVMGTSSLVLPARSVCDLSRSGYGLEWWNRPCEAEQRPFTITVRSTGSNTEHPRVDFMPELRFNPSTTVMLYMYAKGLTRDDATKTSIFYCGPKHCVNEALNDPSLTSYVDVKTSVMYRRIKHFSGYMVAE